MPRAILFAVTGAGTTLGARRLTGGREAPLMRGA
jgi:hypothetical protein